MDLALRRRTNVLFSVLLPRVAVPLRPCVARVRRRVQVEVIQLNEDTGKFVSRGVFDHPYPTTKIMWIPDKTGSKEDLVATTGDYLRLWNVRDDGGPNGTGSVKQKCLLNNVCAEAAALPALRCLLPARNTMY